MSKETEKIFRVMNGRGTTEDLIDTIKTDCRDFEKVVNNDAMIYTYLSLNECSNSKETGLYQLLYNGVELHYGTLREINAVVKSLLKLKIKAEEYSV